MEFKTIVTGTKAAISKALDFIKENSFVLVILAIFILFHPFFEKAASTLIVDTFLCQLQESLLSDVILFLLSLVVIIRCILLRRKNYYLSSKSVLLSLISLFVIGYYRFLDYTWDFHSTYLFESIKYVDIAILYFSSNLVISFSYKKKELFSKKNDFEDALDRKSFAISIANYILNHEDFENSYAIGIIGKWGEGKTVFMNFINESLVKSKRNDYVIIEFNPWYSSSPKALVFDFFTTLQKGLKKYNSNIDSVFNSYARQLVRFYDKNNAIETIFDSFANSPATLKEKFDEVRKSIAKIEKKVVICIDDLDRLDKDEIVEVVRLIRNTANFGNTVFVVTYDKDYVNSALKDINEYGCEKYLEKIFQHEVVLPAFSNSVLEQKLEEKLNTICLFDIEKNQIQLPVNGIQFPELYNFFSNLRDVDRFINQFTLPFAHVRGYINEKQFFYLQLLSFKYPLVYNLIRTDLYDINVKNHFSRSYFELKSSNLKVKDEIVLKETAGVCNISNMLKAENYVQKDIDIIIGILKGLFSTSHSYSNFLNDGYNHIFLRLNIKKYFSFQMGKAVVSKLDMDDVFMKSDQKSLNSRISEWLSSGEDDMLETLDLYFKSLDFYQSKEFYEKSMTSLFFFANQPNPNDKGDVVMFDKYLTREKLIFKTVEKLYHKGNETEYKEFLKELFKSSRTPALFSARLLADEIKDWSNYPKELGNFPFNNDEMIDINIGFLKDYLDQSNQFTVQIFWLYHSCDDKLKNKNKKAGDLIIKFAAEKDIIGFLLYLIYHKPDQENLVYLSRLIEMLFENNENFNKFVLSIKNDSPEFKEYLIFHDLLVLNDYTPIEYSFEKLKLNVWFA